MSASPAAIIRRTSVKPGRNVSVPVTSSVTSLMTLQPRSLARLWQAARCDGRPYIVPWSSVETLKYVTTRLPGTDRSYHRAGRFVEGGLWLQSAIVLVLWLALAIELGLCLLPRQDRRLLNGGSGRRDMGR